MNLVIGIDADGVLTDMSEFNIQMGTKFFDKEPANPKAYDVCKMFECTKKEEFEYGLRYFLKYCISCKLRKNADKIITQLNIDGDELHEITARKFAADNNIIGSISRKLFERWLKKHNLFFDSIEYCSEKYSPRDKNIACNKLKVDVMIEDKPEVALELADNGYNILLFDAPYNQEVKHINIKRVYNWTQIYREVQRIKSEKSRTEEGNLEGIKRKEMSQNQQIEYLKRCRHDLLNCSFDLKKANKNNNDFKKFYMIGNMPVHIRFNPIIFGQENIPYQNGILLVANHLNNYDQFLIAKALKRRPFTGMAASTIIDTKRGKVFKKLGATFVDRENSDSKKAAEKEIAIKLLHNQNALIFPEGTRKNKNNDNIDKKILDFKYGAVSIAQKTGAPILPFAIHYDKKFSLVRIGKPIVIRYEDNLVEQNSKLQDIVLSMICENEVEAERIKKVNDSLHNSK